jgi:hypothetical protein
MKKIFKVSFDEWKVEADTKEEAEAQVLARFDEGYVPALVEVAEYGTIN